MTSRADLPNPRLEIVLSLLCAAALAIALLRAFSGYGYDDDTYRMLHTWQKMVSQGVYETSRFQGNIVAEFMLGFTAWIGGSILSNLTVLACSVVSLFFTYKTVRLLDVPGQMLVVALLATNGWFLIASSTSMDYVIAYCFFSIGLFLYLRGFLLPACFFLAIAAGTRLPYFAISVAAVFGWQFANRRYEWRDFLPTAQFCIFLLFISGLFYLPVWIGHGLRFDWLNAATPDQQGVFGLIARFFYKVLYLFGPVGSVLAFGALLFRFAGQAREDELNLRHRAVILSASVIAVNLAIFARVPVDVAYLIPVIPFVGILLIGIRCQPAVWVLILGNIFANCVGVELLQIGYHAADPCARTFAEGARLRPHLQAGLLVQEFRDLSQQDVCYRNHLLLYPYKDMWSPLPVTPPDKAE